MSDLSDRYISDALGSPIIGEFECDQYAAQPLTPDGTLQSTGYIPRDYRAKPEGSIEFCSPVPGDFLIPRSEWRAIIKAQEEAEATLRHVRNRAEIKTKSQNGTNFCWYFGTVAAAQICRAAARLPTVELSPTAGACRVKRYKNQGGNTFDAIPDMAEFGVPSTKYWPLNQIDDRYDTPQARENGLRHRMTEWFELKSNSFDHAASALLRGMPCILGLAWWGHMICGLRLVALEGNEFGIEIENSHGESYGEKGLAILTEKRATAFDQACPRVMMAA